MVFITIGLHVLNAAFLALFPKRPGERLLFLVRYQPKSRPLFSPLSISIITTIFFIKVNTVTHQGLDAIRDTHWVLLHTHRPQTTALGSKQLLHTREAKVCDIN